MLRTGDSQVDILKLLILSVGTESQSLHTSAVLKSRTDEHV